MKKYSKTFVKLYSSMPAKGGHKDALESPLGNDGMGGMSDMSRWAYTRQIASWTEKAHKMVPLALIRTCQRLISVHTRSSKRRLSWRRIATITSARQCVQR